jgi:tetratricopeptide (TPR) repeat protein
MATRVLLMMGLLAWVGPARAQDTPKAADAVDPDEEIARGHFEAGRAFYEKHQYAHALFEFEAARRAKPAPAFDYNIGRCYDRMDRPKDAVREYQRYLDSAPPPVDAAEVRERVKALEARLPPPGPALTATTPPPAPPPRRSKGLAIALGVSLTAASALALGLGLGLGLSSSAPALTPSPFPVVHGTP